jgi:hypothetical protein
MRNSRRESPIEDPIATWRLTGLDASGKRRQFVLEIGRPYTAAEDAACPVALWGLDGRYPDMAGIDTFQALCLAMRLALTRLGHYREQGGRLFFTGGVADSDDADDPSSEITDEALAGYFGRWEGKNDDMAPAPIPPNRQR